MRKLFLSIFFLIALILGCANPKTDLEVLGPENWPTTVDATVDDIILNMSKKDKKMIRNTKKDDLIKYHHGWGTGIRNYYGLWRGNDKLRKDACGKECHPDSASMIIIERAWEKLQNKG